MRIALLVALCAAAACTKHPKPTLPQIPDSTMYASQETLILPECEVFNHMWRYSGHAGQAFAFYKPIVEPMGAKKKDNTFVDDNLVKTGGYGRQGSATPKDCTKPGVYIAIEEGSNETVVDVWESVPKAPK